MEVSTEKSKIVTNRKNNISADISMNCQKLEEVTSFKYLGVALSGLPQQWPNKTGSGGAKPSASQASPNSILLYGRETRTLLAVSRSSGLAKMAKTILQGTVKGGKKRRQSRQRKRWEDFREWTDLSSVSPRGQWKTGKKWRKLVANHLWCPNIPRS